MASSASHSVFGTASWRGTTPSDLVLDAVSRLSTYVSYLRVCKSQGKHVHWSLHHIDAHFGSSHARVSLRGTQAAPLISQLRLGQIEAEGMAVVQGGTNSNGCRHCLPLAFSAIV